MEIAWLRHFGGRYVTQRGIFTSYDIAAKGI